MQRATSATQIPLPFAVAAIGLILSYIFPGRIGVLAGTGIGFGVGVLLLYIADRSSTSRQRSRGRLVCPNCKTELEVIAVTGREGALDRITSSHEKNVGGNRGESASIR